MADGLTVSVKIIPATFIFSMKINRGTIKRIKENQNDDEILPSHLIILNHGHDGDCDCWDTRTITETGEHPIVYHKADSPEYHNPDYVFSSFRAYLERLCRRGSLSSIPKPLPQNSERWSPEYEAQFQEQREEIEKQNERVRELLSLYDSDNTASK